MVLKCPILLNNEAVTVVDFNGAEVQFPSIHQSLLSISVLYKDGKYTIVDDDYKEEIGKTEYQNSNINKGIKKTTFDNMSKYEKSISDNK